MPEKLYPKRKAPSFRITIVVRFVIVIILLLVIVFIFLLLFLDRFMSQEDVGRQPIRRV
jgi:hypothetical protein